MSDPHPPSGQHGPDDRPTEQLGATPEGPAPEPQRSEQDVEETRAFQREPQQPPAPQQPAQPSWSGAPQSGGPAGGTQHRYDDTRTGAWPQQPGAQGSPVGGFGFAADDDAERRRRTSRPGAGVVAAILVAALVVGGLAGLAGAAGFSLIDGSDSESTSSSSPTGSNSPVSNSTTDPSASAVEKVSAAVLPSVVKINVRSAQAEGSGSGIIISSDGEILTNNHVAAAAGDNGDLSVSFNDGTTKKAKVVGTDPVTDLAVVKAQDVSGLKAANIGTTKRVAVGENVVAIGSPFGLEATVTSGIVSALNRPVSVASSEGQQDEQPQPFGEQQPQQPQQGADDTTYPAIQTDAAINPGNSGGPLVDLDGDVVGINSSIRTASSSADSSSGGSIGLGFAIPISKVWPVVQQLRTGDKPTHARMGVSVSNAPSSDGLVNGAIVESVTDGSGADKAGVEKGNVITKVGDDVVTGSESLVATIRGYRPGDKVTLTVTGGDDDPRQVDVTLDSDEGSASQ